MAWLAFEAGTWVASTWVEASESNGEFDSTARSSDSRSKGSSDDDEYNFNWLDPEKKIYVLQNRKFLKGGHVLLSVTGGGWLFESLSIHLQRRPPFHLLSF